MKFTSFCYISLMNVYAVVVWDTLLERRWHIHLAVGSGHYGSVDKCYCIIFVQFNFLISFLLQDKRKDSHNCSVLCCVLQLCTMIYMCIMSSFYS